MIAIIDYGVGNLFSLKSSLEYIGVDIEITSDPEKIKNADKLILPGVGAFGDAARKLSENGLDKLIKEEAVKGKSLLGICLGMQLLFENGYEYGVHKGLGLIKGDIIPIENTVPKGYKVPHIGWNSLTFPNEKEISPLFKYINQGDFVYFVHSFYGSNCTADTIATTDYGAVITAAVGKDNIYGCQFHPEKSGTVGLNILKSFCEMEV